MVYRRIDQLGHRAVRVYVASARESHRLRRDESRAVEDSARGHHAIGVCPIRGAVHEPAFEVGLPVCSAVPDGCGIFYFS